MPEPRIVMLDGVSHTFPADATDAEIASALDHAQPYRPDPTLQSQAVRRNAESTGTILPPRQHTDELGNAVDRNGKPIEQGVMGRIAGRIASNPALQSVAHPSSLGDIAALLVPNSMGAGETSLPSLARGAFRTLKAGGQAAADGSYAGAPMRFIRGAMSELKRPLSVESFAPNVSGGPLVADAERLNRWDTTLDAPPRGIPQGTYAQLPDGSWGVKALPGHTLVEGETANIMNRAGTPKIVTISKIGADGIAPIGGGSAAPEMSIGGDALDPKLRDLILQRLRGQ